MLLALLLVGWQNHAQVRKNFAVVELFTSEGCSTCPPAEKLLSEIHADAEKNHRPVYCLEYHVDYWNRNGWKDPYSSFKFTLRQKNYTSVLNEESLYTPMMVVNGQVSFTGSDAARSRKTIDSALTAPETIQLKIKIDSTLRDTLFVSYQASKHDKNYFITFALTESKLISKVAKGENAGRTLAHDHVVRTLVSGEANGSSPGMKIPLKNFVPGKNCELIAFIQHKQSMKILAATSVAF